MVHTGPGRDDIEAVVLAGGRGARMGGADKAWVAYAGRPLVEHVVARVRPQAAALRVNAVRNLERYRALGVETVADDSARFGEFAGPLVGMLAGLVTARRPWVAFVPCDAPFLPPDLLVQLAGALRGARAALASCAGRRQPVICLLPAVLAARLDAALAQGERRPDDFLRAVGAAEVAFADGEAFANINTLERGAAAAPARTP